MLDNSWDKIYRMEKLPVESEEENEFKEKVRKEIEIITSMNVVDITIVAKGIYMPEEKKKED